MSLAGQKRASDALVVSDRDSKKSRTAQTLAERKEEAQRAVVVVDEKTGIARSSNLSAPTMLLSGHEGKVYCSRFSPNGEVLASAGHDKNIFLWDTFGQCRNFAMLKGHKKAVLSLKWSTDGEHMFSASADKTAAIWDAEAGTRTKQIKEHASVVNCIDPSRRGNQMLVTCSDDGTAKIWDVRVKASVRTFDCMYQSTACAFSDDATQIFTAGIDNDIKVWDIRGTDPLSYTLQGHMDTVTSLELSPDGGFLLSNSMDNSVCQWDVKPYAPENRCVKVFQGAAHNMEKNLIKATWHPDQTKIICGSSDKHVYIFDTNTTRMLYRLPGHTGAANDVHFHPNEPIIASCGSDKNIFLGEIHI